MKTELTEVSASRRRLHVEVPTDAVDAAFERALKGFRRRLNVPGFRPGKAPLELVRKRLGDELGAKVAESLIEEFGPRAIEEQGLRAIEGSISMQLEEGQEEPPPAGEGESYAFTLFADVMPQIEPKDFKGIKVARTDAELEPEEIEQEMNALRDSLARLVPVEDRGAASGDIVEIDVEGKQLDGEVIVEKGTQAVRLGEPGILPEFEQHFTGVRAGDEFAFEATYPEDAPEAIRGRVVYFRGSVRSVLSREVPDLDDELAKSLGDGIESVADLREKVRDSLVARKKQEAERVLRRRLLDKLLDANPFEAPISLVDREVRSRLEGLGRQLASQGLDPESLDIDWKEVVNRQRGEAEKTVREALLLDAIARREGLAVSDEEIDRAVSRLAEDSGETPAAVRRKLSQGVALEGLKSQILRAKCLDGLVAAANIV